MTETVTEKAAMKEHAIRRPYVLVMFILTGVTAVEILFFTPVDIVPADLQILPLISRTLAIAILMLFAVAKASLVGAYYMHLKYERLAIRLIPLAPLVFVGVLVLTLVLEQVI